jgi:hypothetical protein
MRVPSAAELVRVWELGRSGAPWYRALLLLAPLFPDAPWRTIREMTLGARNGYLLALRERLFGSTIDALSRCPSCNDRMEFSLPVAAMLEQLPAGRPCAYEHTVTAEAAGRPVVYRLLCSDDLAAVAPRGESQPSAMLLAQRALVDLPDGNPPTPDLLNAVSEAVLDADPLASMRLGLRCVACGHEWVTTFDIASFLWTEVEAEVLRLFDDVHRLGAAYGWSEAAILTMSAHRRREYLLRVS